MRGGLNWHDLTVVLQSPTPHPPFGHLLPQGEKAMWPRSPPARRAQRFSRPAATVRCSSTATAGEGL